MEIRIYTEKSYKYIIIGDSKKLLSVVPKTDNKNDEYTKPSTHIDKSVNGISNKDNNCPFIIKEKNRYINPAVRKDKKMYPTVKSHQNENTERIKTPKYNVRSSFYINKEKPSMNLSIPPSSNDSIEDSVKSCSQSLNLNSEVSIVQQRIGLKSPEKQLQLASRLQNDLLQTRFFK
jgi:hypothetical protein